DKPRFRARGPKSPSGARNHREPTRGQQNASPIVIRLAAVSISRSDGPLCGEDGSMLDSGATERLPPERNPAPAKAGQYSRFVLVLFLEQGNPRVRSKENGCARDGVLRCLYVEGAGHDVQRVLSLTRGPRLPFKWKDGFLEPEPGDQAAHEPVLLPEGTDG